jgi:hypothetical protein
MSEAHWHSCCHGGYQGTLDTAEFVLSSYFASLLIYIKQRTDEYELRSLLDYVVATMTFDNIFALKFIVCFVETTYELLHLDK